MQNPNASSRYQKYATFVGNFFFDSIFAVSNLSQMLGTDADDVYAFYMRLAGRLLCPLGGADSNHLLLWCPQEAYREEQLINRLMRQSQQERRIAVQLMHVRHEKEVLWQNRIFREKQYEERRLKEFQDALDREAVNTTFLKHLSEVTFDSFYQVG